MKKIISIIFAMLFIVSMFSLHTEASTAPIKVFQDGKELKFDIDPIVENGRTLVELRGIFEAFNVKLSYDSSTKVIKGEHEYNNVSLTIGSKIAYVNNQKVTLEVPAKVINGRTVVPLRFIGEAIRTNVQWNPNERNIVLTTPIDGNKIRDKEKETINPIDKEIINEENKKFEEKFPQPNLSDMREINNEIDRHNSAIQKLKNDFLDYELYISNKIRAIRNEGLVYPYSYETYQRELNELNTDRSNLRGELNKLILDDTLPARNKKRDLEQKIDDLDNRVSELMESNGRKLQIIGLENLLEEEKLRYEEAMKQENQLHRENMNRLGR